MNKALCLAIAMAVGFTTSCNRDPNVAKVKYVENGNKYFDQGKYKEALIMYRNALRRDMKYGEAYYRSALAEARLQRWAEAIRDLQRAIELQPQNLDAHNQLTNIYLTVYVSDPKRPKRAIEELKQLEEKYVKQFPKSYELQRLQGYLALFDGKLEAAAQKFEAADSIKPDQPDLAMVRVQTLAQLKRFDDAEKIARDLLNRKPELLSMYDALYLLYGRQNRVADAENVLKAKVEKNPDLADPKIQMAAHLFATQQRDKMNATIQQLAASAKAADGPLKAGDFLMRIGDLSQAATVYQAGLQKFPKEKSDFQKRLVEVLVKQNRAGEANQLVAEMLKADPKDSDALALRASLSLLGGSGEQVQSAITDLQSVIAKKPDNHVLRYNLGRAYLAKNNPQAARVQFEEALKLRPDYGLPKIALAQIYLQNREFAKAVQVTQDALAYEPGNIPARLLRTRALMGIGDYQQARQELEGAAKVYPDLPEVRLQLAALDLRDKSFKKAEDAFRVLHSQSGDPRAMMGLVESYVQQGQAPAAMKALRDQLAKEPERLEYRVALASLATRSGDFPAAISEYKSVLAKAPNNAQVWMQLADTHRMAGDYASAVAGFKKAQELAPNNAIPYAQLALLHDLQGQKDQAKPFYEQALRLEPNNYVALNNLAYMMAEKGTDLDQALNMAQRARQQSPNNPDVADTLGWIFIKKNLPDSAIPIYRDLVQKVPNRATYRLHLANALHQKGDKAQAKRELEAALKLNPPPPEQATIRELMAKLN